MIALRDSEKEPSKQGFITQNYLINNASTFPDKIKLKQVTKDWDGYKALINREKFIPGIINNAYQFLLRLINENRVTSPQIKFEHYILALQRINVAIIFLDERPFKGEDPQIIFETLNSLGKPLTLSDLVRNFVLLNMDSNSQTNIYENIWHPKIEKILNDNTSEFFRDYLQYMTVSSVKAVSDSNTKEVYQLFKGFVNEKFKDHNGFINDIVPYVICYKWIITEINRDTISSDTEKDKQIKELLRNIFHDIKSEAFKPFVLGLLGYHQYFVENTHLSDDDLILILSTIRTYLIRRRILGLAQGENKNIVLLSNKIESLANSNISMFELLSSMFYRMRLPNDEELKNRLIQMNFYDELKKYSKFILGKMEEQNTKVAVDFRNPKITIEHIMPQKLDENWEVQLGPNYEVIHKTYLHNIGNLILTEFNSEIGNKSFPEKKIKLNTSSLHFRLDVINKNAWDEASILEHQRNMINVLLETFPIPYLYQEKSNWNTRIIDATIFSPLDDDAGDVAEGNKPSELHLYDVNDRVNTWQDVFIKFLRHIKNNENIDFEYILENQYELFKRNETIIKWKDLKSLIDNKKDIINRYKTFEGKVCNKVRNLNDELLFIHVNISASGCMNRIGAIMNKFNIPQDSVKIVLK